MKTIKTTPINKISKMVLALVAVAVTLASCKKDEQITPTTEPVPQQVTIITSGNWVLESMKLNGKSAINYLDDCERDDITKFNADGTYVTDASAIKCDPNDKQTSSGVWEFTDNFTKMIIDKEDLAYVTILTKEKLQIRDTTYEDGVMEIQEMTFLSK